MPCRPGSRSSEVSFIERLLAFSARGHAANRNRIQIRRGNVAPSPPNGGLPERIGTAAISPTSKFEAGSFHSFTLVYTAGYFGIDDTGSIKIVHRFAAIWDGRNGTTLRGRPAPRSRRRTARCSTCSTIRTDHTDAIEIDGLRFAVLPGFVDIHAHPSSEPMLKGLTDEVGSRQL